jgi:2-octaprenyl-3-methyl-6-methoxy-1,4-benzoquinol hydroxylase
MQALDLIYRNFSNQSGHFNLLHNVGLGIAGKVSPARNKVMRFAMGLEGPLPEMAKSE